VGSKIRHYQPGQPPSVDKAATATMPGPRDPEVLVPRRLPRGDLLLPLSRRGAAAVDLDLNPSGPDQISSQPKSHPPTAAGDLLATANPLRTAVGGGGRWTPLPPRVTAGQGQRRRRRLTTGASPRGVLSDGGGSGRRWKGRAEGGMDGDSPGTAWRRRLGGERSGESQMQIDRYRYR
jgi:hypothetical protein